MLKVEARGEFWDEIKKATIAYEKKTFLRSFTNFQISTCLSWVLIVSVFASLTSFTSHAIGRWNNIGFLFLFQTMWSLLEIGVNYQYR